MKNDFLEAIKKINLENKTYVVATLAALKGSAPQIVGAKMIITDSGIYAGTVGGGKIEAHVIKTAQDMIREKRPTLYQEWNLQTEIGMTCGGAVTFFLEKIEPINKWEIAVFGAGHVSQALCRLLLNLDCVVTCIDHRQEWTSKLPVDPKLKIIHSEHPKEHVSLLSPATFIVSMTMGHAHDVPILEQALKCDFPFIGVIGSKSKANAIKKDLRKLQLADSEIDKLICPIGEKIGNNTPYEIAFSIISQLLKIRDSII